VMVATVYGRFHYVLDTVAGAALAIAVVAAYASGETGICRYPWSRSVLGDQ